MPALMLSDFLIVSCCMLHAVAGSPCLDSPKAVQGRVCVSLLLLGVTWHPVQEGRHQIMDEYFTFEA